MFLRILHYYTTYIILTQYLINRVYIMYLLIYIDPDDIIIIVDNKVYLIEFFYRNK